MERRGVEGEQVKTIFFICTALPRSVPDLREGNRSPIFVVACDM